MKEAMRKNRFPVFLHSWIPYKSSLSESVCFVKLFSLPSAPIHNLKFT
jgi:hypothetical protein